MADVASQLPNVFGQGRRGVYLEVRDDLRAERLAEDEDPLDVLVFRDLRSQARVLQALRADTEDDLAARVLFDSRARLDDSAPMLTTQ